MSEQPSGTWNEDRLVRLRELWAKGVSVTQIGRVLGVSRNAVVGKAQRLGLPRRRSPIPEVAPPAVAGRRRALQEVAAQWARTRCCWPIGDPQNPEFRFCGAPVSDGRPYCEEHCEQAYNVQPLRSSSA